MIVLFCLLLNVAVFLLVNCDIFDDPAPATRRTSRKPVTTQPTKSAAKSKEKSEKKIKYDTTPKTTDPKMKVRACNDNETVDETPSQWGDTDAKFTTSPARGKKKKK